MEFVGQYQTLKFNTPDLFYLWERCIMAQREDLHALLVSLLGSQNVYFQPPPTIVMKYDCIVYKREYMATKHAGNKPYNLRDRYLITAITKHPDSDLREKIAGLPLCTYDRFYTADNLNHDVFKIFF